ncbi:MAG TPA: EAL domain-containing protein [Solirubrobacteraceae bacterium]|nr:EAL domain-containing protein [Solirubrobacteraceae bacterium]
MIHGRAQDWTEILGEVLGQPGRVRPHFQPVVDLQRGEVCGYEALARFPGRRDLRPADVFAAAERHGVGGVLEAHMVREVLAAVPHLPANRFLAVNASPRALVADEVHDAFAEAGRLDRVIVEVTEQTDADPDALAGALSALRARGALVAVDDAGAGYGSLSRITALRPNFVKVDRGLVANVDTEPAKAAVVQTLRELASRIDAWIIAEGVERMEELEMLMELRVPLAQGFAFGTPAAGMAELEPELGLEIRTRYRPAAPDMAIAGLIEAVPTLPEPVSNRALGVLFERRPRPDYVALVDGQGRPSGLVRRTDHDRGDGPVRKLMLVTLDMPLAAVTRRAMTRPPDRRFDPLVCWDHDGRYAGLVRMERVVDALASAA